MACHLFKRFVAKITEFHKRKFAEVNSFCPATLTKLNEITLDEFVLLPK